MELLLGQALLLVFNWTFKLVVTAIILRHPELSDEKAQAIARMFKHKKRHYPVTPIQSLLFHHGAYLGRGGFIIQTFR